MRAVCYLDRDTICHPDNVNDCRIRRFPDEIQCRIKIWIVTSSLIKGSILVVVML